MSDKEVANISQIKDYIVHKNVYHTGACTIFTADVTYESKPLQTLHLQHVEVQYQYVDPPAILIYDLNPPYHEDFRTQYQNFVCENTKLIITGIGKNGYPYKVTIE